MIGNMDYITEEIAQIKKVNEDFSRTGHSIQEKRITEILKFATSNVEFYKDFKGKQLGEFPIIDKQIILENKAGFVTPVSILGEGEYYEKTTSGSSGTPFAFVQDSRCREKLTASLKYWNYRIGIKEGDPILHMRSLKQYYQGNHKREDMALSRENGIFYVDNADMNEEKLSTICKIIYDNHIRLIRGYLTSVDLVTDYAVENRINLFHPGEKLTILSNGEMLTEKVRHRIVDIMGCDVVSQYGTEELGILGMSEINQAGDRICLDLANHYFEILKMDKDEPAEQGEVGRIVVTDLSNLAMPFIRYNLGDLGVAGAFDDGTLTVIEHLVGRQTDIIYRTDGTYLDFFNSCPASIHNNEDILQWQFIQRAKKEYTLKIKPRNNNPRVSQKQYIEDLKDLLGNDAQISICFEENIPVQVSGKRRTVINECHK